MLDAIREISVERVIFVSSISQFPKMHKKLESTYQGNDFNDFAATCIHKISFDVGLALVSLRADVGLSPKNIKLYLINYFS